MVRFRPLWFEQFEPRLLLTAGVSQVSEAMPIAQIRLELSDLAGQPITSLQAGEEFYLNAYVADVRSEPKGVFAAYFDLAFDADRVVPSGNMEFGSIYKNGLVSGGTASGLLDEVGAFSGMRPVGAGDFLLFRAPFRAEAAGTVSFLAEPASLPGSEVLLYGAGGPLASDEIRFGSVSLNVLGPPNSSQDHVVWPVAGFFGMGNPGLPALLRDLGSPEVIGSLTGSLLTATDHNLLHRGTTSMLDNRNPVTLLADRASDSQTPFDLLNEGIVLANEFSYAARLRSVDPEWQDRGLFIELSPRLSARRGFSMMEGLGFLFDEYGTRAAAGSSADDRVGETTGRSALFHDHQWLTAGLLRIGWTTELGRNKDAALAYDGEMLDLGQIAYETLKSTKLRRSAFPRIDGTREDDEWLAGLDRTFSEETEIEGLQGAVMAMEVDLPNRSPPRQEAASRPASDQAVPTDSRSNKRAEDDSERKPHDDTTPAA